MIRAVQPSIAQVQNIFFQAGKWSGKQVFNVTFALSHATKQHYFLWVGKATGVVAAACLVVMAWIRLKPLLHTVHVETKELTKRYSNTRLFLVCTKDSGESSSKDIFIPYNTFSIQLNFPATVVITEGDEPKLKIDADQAILPLIEHQHINDTLILDVKPNSAFETESGIMIGVIIPKSQQFKVAVNHQGKAILKGFACPQLECSIEGNSSVLVADINIVRERQKIHIKGQGGFISWSKAKASEVRIEGNGEVFLGVLNDLYANIQGEGKISCYNPQPKNYRREGSGGDVVFDCKDLLDDSRAPQPSPTLPASSTPAQGGRASRTTW